IMISSVWGLAIGAVDGSTSTDFYCINRKNREVESADIVTKKTQLKPDITSGIKEEPVAEELRDKSSLKQSQIDLLVDYAFRLEEHYGYALDIEWAIDQNEKLYILQARPLKHSQKFSSVEAADRAKRKQDISIADHPVLLKGGTCASEGTAAGLAYVIESDHVFHHIPEGSIAIIRQTSPRYVPIMSRIRAIVTDVGSMAGHMACVAREFHIPTLVGTGTATKTIPSGEEITVDTTNMIVYKGRVEELLSKRPAINPMKGGPVYKIVRSILKKIAPLYLIDPKKENFRPDACKTMHDIIRFAHEMAMQAMFQIGDDFESEKTIAIPLRVYLPFNVYAVDLGGGLAVEQHAEFAEIDDITSVPLKALLDGMKHKNVDWTHDPGVKFSGFVSIVAESVFRDPMKEGRMGGPNYAVIAKNYLNFNSRLGYHFATIDTFCGPVLNDNYIVFSFKGGAADIGRRSRRALLIALILKRLGFKVEQTGDMLRGEIKKYEQKTMEKKLDMLGRLLASVRFLDMILSDDGVVEWYVTQFFKGNYTFQVDSAQTK
ncbi:MAG: pyruvate, phosphate dikinase, partial [Deltaproteobacteria bacterium]|nr:pyruvate, phosphate dikinase [Deltaproteobacteria bacterium]